MKWKRIEKIADVVFKKISEFFTYDTMKSHYKKQIFQSIIFIPTKIFIILLVFLSERSLKLKSLIIAKINGWDNNKAKPKNP